MRHLKSGYKLGRNPSQRRALLRNLTGSVIERERVYTTITKAKAVRPLVEKMITLGKSGDLSSKRRALAYLFKRKTVHILFDEVAPRFMDREGGYTRIIKGDFRKGDGAEMAYIEFVDYKYDLKTAKAKAKDKDKKKK